MKRASSTPSTFQTLCGTDSHSVSLPNFGIKFASNYITLSDWHKIIIATETHERERGRQLCGEKQQQQQLNNNVVQVEDEDDVDCSISKVRVLYTGGTIGMANKGPHKGRRTLLNKIFKYFKNL